MDFFCRDLKPGNLLVSRSCNLRITDFGLARERPSVFYLHALLMKNCCCLSVSDLIWSKLMHSFIYFIFEATSTRRWSHREHWRTDDRTCHHALVFIYVFIVVMYLFMYLFIVVVIVCFMLSNNYICSFYVYILNASLYRCNKGTDLRSWCFVQVRYNFKMNTLYICPCSHTEILVLSFILLLRMVQMVCTPMLSTFGVVVVYLLSLFVEKLYFQVCSELLFIIF